MTKLIMHLLGYLLIINVQNDKLLFNNINVGAKFTFSLLLLLIAQYFNNILNFSWHSKHLASQQMAPSLRSWRVKVVC